MERFVSRLCDRFVWKMYRKRNRYGKYSVPYPERRTNQLLQFNFVLSAYFERKVRFMDKQGIQLQKITKGGKTQILKNCIMNQVSK